MEDNKKMKHSIKKYITHPLRGYVSPRAQSAIKLLEAAGFDPDIAFSLAEAMIPEGQFYDLDRETPDGE